MKKSKKLLALLMAIAMMVTMFPFTAFALDALNKSENIANSDFYNVTHYHGDDFIAYQYDNVDKNTKTLTVMEDAPITITMSDGAGYTGNSYPNSGNALGWHYGDGSKYGLCTTFAFYLTSPNCDVSGFSVSGFGSQTSGSVNISASNGSSINTTFSNPNGLPAGTYTINVNYKFQMKKNEGWLWDDWQTKKETNENAISDTITINVLPLPRVDYTYTFANGSSQIVSAKEGTAPVAPANTVATPWTSDGAGSHTRTTYSWPEWNAQTTTYTEIATPESEACSGGAASCTDKAVCTVCGGTYGELAAHTFTADSGEMVSAATCQQKQINKAACAVCGAVSDDVTIEVGELAEHNYSELVSEKVDATVDAPGKEAVYKCQWCDATKGGKVIEQLPHYVINVSAENGTATVNGEADTDNVAVNGDVTLVATPAAENYKFVGWSLNDKIVSTDETYVTKAIADATYVAKYAEVEAATFTVVFTDKYGNVYSTQDVTSGTEVKEPEAPVLAGFTFKGWSLTAEEIDALTSSTKIVANFEKSVVTQYTVTVGEGCTIADFEGTTATVDYNTKVTVNAPAGSVNGTWMVDDAVVGYGTSYTFFVGADIELTYVEDASVEAEPTVAAVTTVKEGDGCEVAFLATRSLADGYTYVNAGFVYGKNLTESDLNLDKVGTTGTGTDSGKVKAVYCSTDSEQFRLSYGITAMTGTASAKAFLAYVDKDGETVVIYGETQSYKY